MTIQPARTGTARTPPSYWSAPIFAAVLSAMTLAVPFLEKSHSYEPGFPAFFGFLPAAFYFAARAQVNSQKQIHALQARIEQLEAQAAPSGAPLR